jgi:hypothetical protein
VTAAEYVAIQEVLGGGGQTVTLNHRGAATGGDISLNQVGALSVSEIVVAKHVTALDNFSNNQSLSLSGDLLNYGSIDAISTNSKITAGTISAVDIVNEAGGVISTSAPSNLKIANAVPCTSLTLSASDSIVNAGQIKSGGDLNLSSVSGNFINSGLISSSGGNVNFATPTPHAINIDSTGGMIQAVSGNINVRDASYTGSDNTNLVGGNYLSQNLNVYANRCKDQPGDIQHW